MSQLGHRFDEALHLAADLHRGDVRKGGDIPYLSHLLAVAALVVEDGGSEDEAIAALLHDAAEEHGHHQLDVIGARFGDEVRGIVAACTDTLVAGKAEWETRKRAYLAHLRTGGVRPALRVSLADKLHNARAILRDYLAHGEELWARFRRGPDHQLWYYRALARTFHEVQPGPMATELVEAVGELGRLVAESEARAAGRRGRTEEAPDARDADGRETHVVAVDWSGRLTGPDEHIWPAEARGGFLVRLENGRDRDTVVEEVIATARRHPRLVVGFDFAFSFPSWFVRDRLAARSGPEVWQAVAERGEDWLANPSEPFWGPGGVGRPPGSDQDRYRATERSGDGSAKSVFQLAGAGQVGTGSLRGMPQLRRLAEAGFSVWPFEEPGWPRVVEIYPAVFTAGVRKSRRAQRIGRLAREPFVPSVLRERAGSREDAFDAAVSALAMSGHVSELEDLPSAQGEERIEGAIWRPSINA